MKYNKGDVIKTIPMGVVIVVKRLRDSRDILWYVCHTADKSEFQFQDKLIKGLASEDEARSFRNKMKV